jgi:hypothetical protein
MIKPHLTKTSIMKRKSLMIRSMIVPMTAVMFLLSSCINDADLTDSTNTGSDSTPKTLTLTINTGSTGTRVYNQTTDPGTTSENTINRVTVGIFGTDNNVKIIKEFEPGGSSVSVTSASLASGDQVLVAVNTPTGTFKNAATVSEFESKTMTIDESLATSASGSVGVVEVPGNLPMFGTGSITGTTSLTATVPVYHLVSKIALNSLKVDFDANGAYSTATFTPTEVFLLNVPDKVNIYPIASYSYYSPSSWYEGAVSADGINTTNYPYREYLGTGDISSDQTVLSTSGTATWANKLYFYTMPNSGSSNKTRLVIKGDFDPDGGTNENATTYYYPITINPDNSGTVVPNQSYQLSVIIKSIGTDSPTGTISQESVGVTVTVQPFADPTSQEETFQ